MAYSDFTNCFTHLTICHLEPQRMKSKVKWTAVSPFSNSYLRNLTAKQARLGLIGRRPALRWPPFCVWLKKIRSYQGSWDMKSGGSGVEGGQRNLLRNPQFKFKISKSGSNEVPTCPTLIRTAFHAAGEHRPDAEGAPAAARRAGRR